MGEQDRNSGIIQDMLRRSAEDDLPEAAAGEGALQHQIGADIARFLQDHLAGRPAARFEHPPFGRDPVAAKMGDHLRGVGTRDHVSLHAQHFHAISQQQQWHAESDRARQLDASVPGDDDRSADCFRGLGRGEKHRATAFKQRRLAGLPPAGRGRRAGSANDDEIEHAAVFADDLALSPLHFAPAGRRAFAVAVSISQNGRPLSRVIFRKSVRAPSANCRHSSATVDRYSGGMDMPGIMAPKARFGWPSTSNPSRWLVKRFARRIAVFSALRAASSS